MCEWAWSNIGTILTRENRSNRRETCFGATLSSTKPTWTGLGLKPGLRGERAVTNRLSRDTSQEAVSYSQSTTNKMQRFSDLFISVRRCTCFRRFFRPSSGAVTVWQMPDAVSAVLCSWWWTEKTSTTCRASYRNKYIWETLHLLGFAPRIY